MEIIDLSRNLVINQNNAVPTLDKNFHLGGPEVFGKINKVLSRQEEELLTLSLLSELSGVIWTVFTDTKQKRHRIKDTIKMQPPLLTGLRI